jgi:hypothetical protein
VHDPGGNVIQLLWRSSPVAVPLTPEIAVME